MRLKVSRAQLLCVLIIFMQLLGSQVTKYFPGIPSSIYQIIFYMKYFGAFVFLTYCLSKKRDPLRKDKAKHYIKIFASIFLLYFAVEFFALLKSPIVASYGMRYWSRFVAYFLDKMCILIEVACLYHICKDKVIRYLESAFIIDGIFVLLMTIVKAGIGQTLLAFPAVFGLLPENKALKLLEVHELTYCFAVCIIYHLFFKETKDKHDKGLLVIMAILFISGGKRIAFLGIVLSAVFAAFVHRKGLKKSMLIYVGFLGVLVCVIWNFILYNGSAFLYFQTHNINVMGRDAIYAYFLNRTRFSPSFIGWGLAGTTKAIENMTRAEVGNMVNVMGLHNDILRSYIECGFFGSIFWYLYNLVHIPVRLFAKFGKKDATLYMTLIIFAFTTYLTSNTENSFVFQVILLLIPLALGEREIIQQTNDKAEEISSNG